MALCMVGSGLLTDLLRSTVLAGREPDGWSDGQERAQTEIQGFRTDRQIERWTDREMDRLAEGMTDRSTDGQIDR